SSSTSPEPKVTFGSEALDDERRLFYVALTRAKKNLFITYHNFDNEGKEILPSVFLSEIKPELKEELDMGEFEKRMKKDKTLFFAESKVAKKREIDKEFVGELFYSQAFSVTALNNYLSCPWKYFYRNLVRIPEVQEKYLIYGTAMHGAVESFFRERMKKEVGKEFLLEKFAELVGDFKESKEMKARGEKAL